MKALLPVIVLASDSALLMPMNKIAEAKYSLEEIQRCIHLLDDLVKNSVELAHLTKEQRIAILKAAGEISRPDRDDEIRKRR